MTLGTSIPTKKAPTGAPPKKLRVGIMKKFGRAGFICYVEGDVTLRGRAAVARTILSAAHRHARLLLQRLENAAGPSDKRRIVARNEQELVAFFYARRSVV